MTSGQLLIVLAVSAATLLAVAALARAGIPAPVTLVVAGLIIGFLPFVPDASLPPELVLLGLLPLLAYDAAITSSPTAILRNARSIGVLAVPLVLATAFGVAAIAHWAGLLSWPLAFVLGTAVAANDAAAATSLARRLRVPRGLLSTLEGEALFNDATALVLYGAAVTAATTGVFSPLHTAGALVYSAVLGCVIGLAVGAIGRIMRSRLDDPAIEISASILLAYAAYLPAEALHASGVLAAVVAGLQLGWHSSSGAFSARNRLQSAAFWETLVFLINAALFVFVGLSFHTFTVQARGPLGRLALTAVAVVAAVIAVRLLWIWAFARLIRSGGPGSQRDWRERLLLGWSGMRGAITLAAILAVPTETNSGQPLAGRDDVVYLGFAVIIGTLLLQGTSLPLLVRRLRLSEHPAALNAGRVARLEIARATIAHIDDLAGSDIAPPEITRGLRAQYLARMRQLEEGEGSDGALPAQELALRGEIDALQRRTLETLREQGQIGVTTARELQRELDLGQLATPPPGAP